MLTIKIHYSLTVEDYLEYQELYLTRIAGFWQKYHYRIFVIFGIIVFVAGINWIFFEHRHTYRGWVSILGGMYLVFVGVWGRWKWRRWFRKNAHLYQNLEGEITDEDLTVRSRTEDTRAKWGHYSGFAESRNLIILLDPQGNWLILPMRAFEPADLESFLKLLHTKLDISPAGTNRPSEASG
ncbi:MAG: YcxB family protein [Acidobacteria bacterium]|nr:MAG: YcxB family protein [Acidobacteriota bacterium]